MNHNKKGNALAIIIPILAILIVAAVVFFGKGGLGKGGGKGDNSGNQSTVEANANISSSSNKKDKFEYISVTISGNDYIYENNRITCEELIDKLKDKTNNKVAVKITNDNASQKAYSTLIDALYKNNINFVE